MNESMSNKAVYRTAPATPGLLKRVPISINFITGCGGWWLKLGGWGFTFSRQLIFYLFAGETP